MKIGILTLPLLDNYGGILQDYALQRTLQTYGGGNNVWLIQRKKPQVYNRKQLLFYYIKRILKPIIKKEFKFTGREIDKFVNKYFPCKSPFLLSTEDLRKYVADSGFDGIVVGSDQVWRQCYTPEIRDYFLGMCEDNHSIKRVAYAASFGVDEWEFTEEETADCKRLASLFDYISVREKSAVDLCRQYLDVNATHVLDPTMLLQKDEYIDLIKEWKEPQSSGDLFYYILDRNDSKTALINKMSEQTGLEPFSTYPRLSPTIMNLIRFPKYCIFPRVTQWLRAFQDARMVITDSFHGCIFSIIFNVPFWVVGNASRGNARFDSLLQLFHLENRLIDVSAENVDYNEPIDWESVNRIRNEMIVKSKAAFSYLC